MAKAFQREAWVVRVARASFTQFIHVKYRVLKALYFLHSSSSLNPSRPNRRRREKININFYFLTSLWCLKRFYEGL